MYVEQRTRNQFTSERLALTFTSYKIRVQEDEGPFSELGNIHGGTSKAFQLGSLQLCGGRKTDVLHYNNTETYLF